MKFIEFELAYDFVHQGIWDEEDFTAFVLDIGLGFMGLKRYNERKENQ